MNWRTGWRKGTIWEAKRPHKYNAKATFVDGWRFASKREADCYKSLKFAQERGEIAYFLRQVPIHLCPPSQHKKTATTLRVDFLVVYPDNSLKYVDAKGLATADWKNKASQAENMYGIRIDTW